MIQIELITPSATDTTDRLMVRRGAGPADHTVELATPATLKGFLGLTTADVSGLAAIATSGSASDLSAGTLPAARFNDTAHGSRAGGSLHADVVAAGASGFMTGADKTKLDGIAVGATANATDAALRARSSHTGDELTGGFGIADTTDTTKRVIFDASGITTATTRTLTLPNNSGQILITAGAQTVSGTKTFSVPPIMATPAAGQASIRLPHGSAPSSPTDGDLWTTTTGLFARLNGSTAQFATGGGSATGTNTGDQTITLTGDVTGSGTGSFAATIANDAVTNAKLANMATATFKGRTTAGTGDPEDLTATQATALLDAFTSGAKGLAPASGGGTTNFLRADGTWAAPGGSGGFDFGTNAAMAGMTII